MLLLDVDEGFGMDVPKSTSVDENGVGVVAGADVSNDSSGTAANSFAWASSSDRSHVGLRTFCSLHTFICPGFVVQTSSALAQHHVLPLDFPQVIWSSAGIFEVPLPPLQFSFMAQQVL